MSKIELFITSRERDLGGFSVRRILPYATHRMVGPFIFFDHMGPAEFAPGEGMDVRPHPHIHLATVTYLFDGVIHHRDSLGSDQNIEPGAVNWMTAGHGIVHSERTPPEFRAKGGKMNGIQLWVALPEEHENTGPTFHHHPAKTLPEFEQNGVKLKLLLGKAFGHSSPAATHSELFYLDAHFPAGASLTVPCQGCELAVYVASGNAEVEGQAAGQFTMAVAKSGEDLHVKATEDSRLMILGGKPVGKRYMFWNFVSSSPKELEQAKADWAKGPGGKRFPKVPGDDREWIPLPEGVNPPGTAL
jgi:redox-sensitive bicupin YhaK (pirin superfamily)